MSESLTPWPWGIIPNFPEQGPAQDAPDLHLTQRGWQAFKIGPKFLIRNSYKSGVQSKECPAEKGITGYSLFMRTGIQLGSTRAPTNIIVIGWLRRERLSRAVLCYENWPRPAAPVRSLGLHTPQETRACLHPVPLNVANKALGRVLWPHSWRRGVILTPISCLSSRTGLQTGIWPH